MEKKKEETKKSSYVVEVIFIFLFVAVVILALTLVGKNNENKGLNDQLSQKTMDLGDAHVKIAELQEVIQEARIVKEAGWGTYELRVLLVKHPIGLKEEYFTWRIGGEGVQAPNLPEIKQLEKKLLIYSPDFPDYSKPVILDKPTK